MQIITNKILNQDHLVVCLSANNIVQNSQPNSSKQAVTLRNDQYYVHGMMLCQVMSQERKLVKTVKWALKKIFKHI